MFSIYKPVLLIASTMGILLFACNDSGESEKAADVTMAATRYAPAAGNNNMNYGAAADSTTPVPGVVNEEQPKQPGTSASAENVDWDKKIIRNASLTVEAKSHKAFNDLVHEQVKRSGGYVAEEEQNKSDYKIENIATIKVPVDQ